MYILLKVIEVKNTSSNYAKLLITEHLPLSSDEKCHVKLIEPSLKHNYQVKLNKQNNLEFDLNIAPSKTEELTIKYTIEQPSEKQIDFYFS